MNEDAKILNEVIVALCKAAVAMKQAGKPELAGVLFSAGREAAKEHGRITK